MYKWQVFLGGVASATFVLAGAAAPALAQTVASSPLTTVTQGVTGSQVSAHVCDMAGSPLSGEVNSALAGLTGQSCNGSSTRHAEERQPERHGVGQHRAERRHPGRPDLDDMRAARPERGHR